MATAIFIFFGVERFGRKWPLFTSAFGMGVLFYIVGALEKTHPPVTGGPIAPASRAMAGLIYIYVVFYSFGVGPLPWVYVSDIFPTRTRHYGLSVASASQWLFNFTVSKITPTMVTKLGWKVFITFATIDIFAICTFVFFLPETKGRSLEEMDIIFGSISKEDRARDITRAEQVVDEEVRQVEGHGGHVGHDGSDPDMEKGSLDHVHKGTTAA